MIGFDPHRLETPCFVFDKREFAQNMDDFRQALRNAWSENVSVAYSVKTNPLPWLLDQVRLGGHAAEVVSDEEYDLARTCGFTPDSIVFNGPIKGKTRFFEALEGGALVNIDSMREIAWLEEYAVSEAIGAGAGRAVDDAPREEPRKAALEVGIRVNFDLEAACPGQTVSGTTGGRFGFSYENGELGRAIGRLAELAPIVKVAGLHMHVTTQGRTVEVYRTLAKTAAAVIVEYGLEVNYVDIGGGFFGGGPANAGAYDAYARAIAEELAGTCEPDQVKLVVEPGGAVVCTPGYYFGRVLDAKENTYDRFVTCELTRLNIDHEMKKTSYAYRIHLAPEAEAAAGESKPSRPMLERQVLCGFTCMESDRLCVLENEPELREGDIIEICNAGAYSMSFTPEFFIRCAPAVYAFEKQPADLPQESPSQSALPSSTVAGGGSSLECVKPAGTLGHSGFPPMVPLSQGGDR